MNITDTTARMDPEEKHLLSTRPSEVAQAGSPTSPSGATGVNFEQYNIQQHQEECGMSNKELKEDHNSVLSH